MVDPDRRPLRGIIEIDETNVPFRRKDEPDGGGQGRSPIGKIFMIGAVEVEAGKYPARCRLQRIVNINRESLHAFIRDNTAVGSLLLTDGNTAYRKLEDRGHQAINLSAVDAPPAHEVLPWVHRLFANFKRWSYGTYHGVCDKHVDIYANEFVFRWNRRRHFQTNVGTILGLGQRIGRTTWRDIVGDTGEWKEAHEDQVLAMVRPDRLDRAQGLRRGTRLRYLRSTRRSSAEREEVEISAKAPQTFRPPSKKIRGGAQHEAVCPSAAARSRERLSSAHSARIEDYRSKARTADRSKTGEIYGLKVLEEPSYDPFSSGSSSISSSTFGVS
ncbi:hypothetical protein QO002_005674 [Pararhizobium capsulatum DSM 1112]|uniref:ISXO2-like transposase domain-containing protein n=1 Tax=Pararhizobium capsulatum DSM 1112 TaxID=1121113 RepID=A0ABU0BZU3_9HYPH|nr:hypothetical protein [Pararhizobium capsulatum DSM 1112]